MTYAMNIIYIMYIIYIKFTNIHPMMNNTQLDIGCALNRPASCSMLKQDRRQPKKTFTTNLLVILVSSIALPTCGKTSIFDEFLQSVELSQGYYC